jgi:hypothetical protein
MNIFGLSSKYNDIVADGNERLNDEPLKIGTKTDNDLSFIVNNQEQLRLTSSGVNIQIDEIQGGSDGKIEICGAELEGCGTIEGEWVQIPNPAVTTEVLTDGKPRVNFSASVSDFVMLNNPFTSEDEINISFRVEKTIDSEFTEVAIGYYGATPPLTFSNPSLVFLNYFGVRSRLPFTDQSNTGNGALTLSPTRHQPNTGAWNWNLAGVYRVRFTLVNGVATWFITPPSKREYRVSSCNIALPLFSGGNWIPYVYNSTTGNITSNSHISKNTEDIVVDGWDVNEQFNHLNELANNEAVEQLPKVLKVLDQESNDWKLERKDYSYTLPERSGKLITVDDIAVNDIDTEVIKLEVSENTVRISQAESDIKDLQGETVANANDITNLQTQIDNNDTDILNLQNADTNLQNQITSNDTDILNLENADTNLQNQITSNDTDILNLQNADTNLQTQIDDNDTDINTLQNSIAELELGTGSQDLTTLNEAVFIEEPSRAYQKAVWSPDYATFNMTFVDNVVTKSSSTDRDSITSQTVLDFTRYNYDILVNLQQVSGSLVHFGFIENELMIDDYEGTWFQVNYAERGQEWGDGLSARIAYPTATPPNRQLVLAFSRQAPSYVSTESFDDLKANQSLLFSIRNGVLTEIHRRNSPTSPWFNYDFSQFNNGGLANSKLRAFPLKQYRMYFSDGSTSNSSFRAAVTYLEQPNTIYSNELQLRQPIRPDIRRSQYYDNDRTGFQYILSEKNRVITIDTSVYPIYFDGPTQTSLEILVEEDPDSIETDYTVYIKHIGSTNTLNIVSGGLTFQDPAESKIEPWCTTVFRISKAGEEGSPLGAVKTIRKLYSDYNQNFIYFEPTANLSNTKADFWLAPYGVLGASPQTGWSGRVFIPARAVLTSFVVLADPEAYNTFLTGSFRIQIYKEQADPYAISLTQTGTLIHDRLIKGRNASFLVGLETNTRLVEINVGLDPDNINSTTPNLIGISPMGNAVHIVEANSVVSVKAIDWSSFDGSGVELKFYLNYQFI